MNPILLDGRAHSTRPPTVSIRARAIGWMLPDALARFRFKRPRAESPIWCYFLRNIIKIRAPHGPRKSELAGYTRGNREFRDFPNSPRYLPFIGRGCAMIWAMSRSERPRVEFLFDGGCSILWARFRVNDTMGVLYRVQLLRKIINKFRGPGAA